jgi:hypothetical protein
MYRDREVAQREALVAGRAKIEEQIAVREEERKVAHARMLEEQAAFKEEAKRKEEVGTHHGGCRVYSCPGLRQCWLFGAARLAQPAPHATAPPPSPLTSTTPFHPVPGLQQAKADAERLQAKRAVERQAVLRANAAAEAERKRLKELEVVEDQKIAAYLAAEEARKRCVEPVPTRGCLVG